MNENMRRVLERRELEKLRFQKRRWHSIITRRDKITRKLKYGLPMFEGVFAEMYDAIEKEIQEMDDTDAAYRAEKHLKQMAKLTPGTEHWVLLYALIIDDMKGGDNAAVE